MRKILCIVDGKIIWSITSLPYSHQYEFPNLCWYYLGGYFLPFSLLHCRFSFENNWRQASGSRHFWSSARDMISYYKNKWLPAIPISSILKICIKERGTYSFAFLPTSYSWSFEGAVRVEIILDQGIQNLSGWISYRIPFHITPPVQAEILQNSQ